jgi:TatD DNase family protein
MVDTHAHLDTSVFDKDRREVIARARDAGVGTIITVGTNLESSKKAIGLAEKYPGVLATVGFHPHDVATVDRADIARLGKIANHPRVVAIGEVGLDFYRNYSPRGAQLQALTWQLDLAAKLELPIIIHCRQAEKDMLNLLGDWVSLHKSPHGQGRGVIHCFSGSNDTARRYLDMGFYLSLGAYIGYPTSTNAHNVIKGIPEDRLLVETDCPFLPPQSYRGKRNEPAYIPITIQALAQIRGKSTDDVANTTTQNACYLFRLSVSKKQ